MYFGQLLPGLSLIVGFFKNFGIVLSLLAGFFNSWASSWGWTKLATLQYFCWFEMAHCWKAKFFGLFYSIRKTNVETATLKTLSLSYWVGLFWKHASVATSVQKVGLFLLKTCLCYHLCPKSGFISSENLPLLPPLSRKWAYFFWKLVSVATSVQKVGLINFADGLFLWSSKTRKPWA